MPALPLVIAPNPLLNTKSEPVQKVDDNLRQFMDDMVKTMYQEGGIGLAAVQVGQLKRVLVMDVDYEPDHHAHDHDHHDCDGIHVTNSNPLYVVNPVILETSDESSIYKEGCLSFPGARADVSRPESVRVKFLDYHGQEQIMNMEGIMATCVQHEIDHLNGVTFVDHLSGLKKQVILKKMRKLQS